jgi:hypothetical protein
MSLLAATKLSALDGVPFAPVAQRQTRYAKRWSMETNSIVSAFIDNPHSNPRSGL